VPTVAAANVLATAAAPLVFRKAVATTSVFPATGGPPSIAPTIMKAPAATTVLARTAATPETTEAALPSTPASAQRMDLEWLTQQVSSRLARRLEIERERLGVRPWRQSSF